MQIDSNIDTVIAPEYRFISMKLYCTTLLWLTAKQTYFKGVRTAVTYLLN